MKSSLSILFAGLLLMGACKGKEESAPTIEIPADEIEMVQTEEVVEIMEDPGPWKAVVSTRFAETGCPYVLVVGELNPKAYSPVNLGERFKVDGLVVEFTYHPSRAMQQCPQADMIVIDDIKTLE